jgi:cytoskeletal protein CcmA (bactofilin family)
VLGSESNLKGDLIYRTLVIEEGAQFQGHCVLAGREESIDSINEPEESDQDTQPDQYD